MRRNAALLVSALLVATGALGPAPAGADASLQRTTDQMDAPSAVVSVNGSANYLRVPAGDVRRWEYAGANLDVSTAFAADTTRLRAAHATTAFERSFDRAETRENRTAVIRDLVDRLEQEADALHRQNREATRAFAEGSISAERFARQRAQIQAEARELESVRQRVSDVVGDTSDYSLPHGVYVRLRALEGTLAYLRGPASGHVGRLAAGGGVDRVYVESSADGYTMAYVTDGQYVRETYLAGQRNASAADQFNAAGRSPGQAAYSRGNELYPWAESRPPTPSIQGWTPIHVYQYRVDFQGGSIVAYLDGGTTNVFREAQQRRLSSMEFTDTVAATNDTLRLRINRTFPTGPMQVRLVRNGTGSPVDGTVTVGGRELGRTGQDGTMWAVQPSEPVAINATTAAGRNVTARVGR